MPLRHGTPLPDLSGATQWLNGNQPGREELAGNPVLIHFWSASCHMCHDNMPKVRQWCETYQPQGLKVVAIHVPMSEEDTDLDRVRQKIEEYGITEPCGVDNDGLIAEAFENQFVPAYYLFDREATLRGRAAGANGIMLLEPTLQKLVPGGE